MEIALRKFDLRNVHDYPTIVVIGKRATGKTTLINEVLTLKSVSCYRVFNPLRLVNLPVNPTSSEYPASHDTYDEFDPNILQSILDKHKTQIEFKHTEPLTLNEQWVIIDDAIFKPSDLNSTALREVFMNGRCMKVGIVLSMSYPMKLCQYIISNIDYVFLFRDDREENIKRAYQMYLSKFTTFDTFLTMFKHATDQPYSCLVIDLTQASNNIEDILYMYG